MTTEADLERISAKLARAVKVITRLEKEARGPRNAPVAIIGMACNFPGAPDLAAFDRLLDEGRDGVSQIPAARFDAAALLGQGAGEKGTIVSDAAGIIEDIDQFDSAFFDYTPAEADALDPQQRLLLETSHAALENAGMAPYGLAGSRTGVWVGMSNNDYGQLRLRGTDASKTHAYDFTGNILATAAGLISYKFDLRGPAMVVDTACSASLTAVADAVAALRSGHVDLALSGGVNAILMPDMQIALSRLGALSPSGRCRTFDAGADGYARSEGCGMVVLKRLADAERDGDPITAVIHGAAVNHDGRSNGMFAPNGQAQRAVIRAALADAGLTPADISVIEAHGTGTKLGDPVEIEALAEVFSDRSGPLPVGAVKSSIGHLEAAAGVAGLIKLANVLKSGRVPRNLHCETMNPLIAWGPHLRPANEAETLQPAYGGTAYGGVSSFGVSGTNAHLVLGAAPGKIEPGTAMPGPYVVSARSEEALKASIERHARAMDGLLPHAFDAACHSTFTTRDLHPWRVAVTAASAPQAAEALRQAVATRSLSAPKVAMVFAGQGSHLARMGLDLHAADPVARDLLDRADRIVQDRLGLSLLADILPDASRLEDTRYAQVAVFAVGAALADVLRRWGITPDLVMGHSLGELVAGYVAGVFGFDEALNFVIRRAGAMADVSGNGGMMACLGDLDEIARICQSNPEVQEAAVNADKSVTLTGPSPALAAVTRKLTAAGVRCVPLPVSGAFHSRMMEPAAATLAGAMQGLALKAPGVPLVSNLTGQVEDNAVTHLSHWTRQLTEPVLFRDGMARIAEAGPDLVIEIGSKPSLNAAMVQALGNDISILHSGITRANLLRVLARWIELGGTPDTAGIFGHNTGVRVPLPTYPFQKRRHWLPSEDIAPPRGPAQAPGLLRLQNGGAVAFEDLRAEDWISDHQVNGRVVFAGAGFLELALRHGAALAGQPVALRDAAIVAPLVLGADAVRVQTELQPQSDGSWQVSISSFASDTQMICHATAQVTTDVPTDVCDVPRPSALFDEPPAAMQARAAAVGVDYGPAFQGIEAQAVDSVNGGATGRVVLKARPRSEHALHPALLDSVFQVAGACLTLTEPENAFLPAQVGALTLAVVNPVEVEVTAQLHDVPGGKSVDLDARLRDGSVAFTVRDLLLHRVPVARLGTIVPPDVSRHVYDIGWTELARTEVETAKVPADPELAEIAGTAFPSTATLVDAHRSITALEDLCLLTAQKGLRDLALPGTGTIGSLAEAGGVVADQRRLFGRLLDVVADRKGANFVLPAWPQDLEDRIAAACTAAQERSDVAKTALVDHAAPFLTDVLQGKALALNALFPGGSDRLVRDVYTLSPMFNAMQDGLGRFIKGLTRNAGRPLRVLEIGAGTGSSTEKMLPHLAGHCDEYVFTDLSAVLLERARRRFADYPFLRTQVLDIGQDTLAQGLTVGRFDLIIGANVVHATPDIVRTLGHLKPLLRPGGLVALVEGVEPWLWADLTFGLTEGWWNFTDLDRRPDHPLLTAKGWEQAFTDAGFAAAGSFAPRGERNEILTGQVLTLARAPVQSSGGTVAVLGEGAFARDVRHAMVAQGVAVTAQMIGAERVFDLSATETYPADPDAAEMARSRVWSQIETLKKLAPGSGCGSVSLVNRGAWGETSGSMASGLDAGSWGAMRAVNRERPDMNLHVLDLAPEVSPQAVARALLQVPSVGGGLYRATRDGLHQAELRRAAMPAAAEPPALSGGSVIITGGFGGLGRLFAQDLADIGAARIVCIGRSRPDLPMELRGAEVVPVYGDVSDPAVIAQALDLAEADGMPLAGVIHAAGQVDDVLLDELDEDRFDRLWHTKVQGAWNLHSALGARTLRFFWLFSSSTGTLGIASQTNHAAACAALDGLARTRSAAGLVTTSIDWGPWSEVGRAADEELQGRIRSMGIRSVDSGVAFARSLIRPDAPAQVAFMDVDWRTYLARFGPDPFLDGLADQPAGTRAADVALPVAQGPKLDTLPPGDRHAAAVEAVLEILCRLLGYGADERPDPRLGLFEIGLDSLTAMELGSAIQRLTGSPAPQTLPFMYPTAEALAGYVLETLGLDETPAEDPATVDDLSGLNDQALIDIVNAEMAVLEAGGHD